MKAALLAQGMPYFSIRSLAKTLLDSIRAAFCVGPKMGMPIFWKWSTMPTASGAFGPTTVRSMWLSLAALARPAMSVAPDVQVLGDRGCAGVTRRGVDFSDLGALRQLPDQGVLPAPAADYQYLAYLTPSVALSFEERAKKSCEGAKPLQAAPAYSHSIVDGGLEVMS